MRTVLASFNQSGKTWVNGDFDYDGKVYDTDLDTVTAFYNQSFPAPMAKVVEIYRVGSEQMSCNSLQFLVVFNKDVTGVDATDFQLVGEVAENAEISSIVGYGGSGGYHPVYLVTVDNVYGNGTLGLNLIDDDSIHDNGALDNRDDIPLGDENDPEDENYGRDNFTGEVYTVSSPFLWDGGGMDDNWNTAANWAGDVVPTDGSSVQIDVADGNTLTLSDDLTDIAGLTKTGLGTLQFTGTLPAGLDPTVQAGTLLVGSLDSVFLDSNEVDFNTMLDSSTRVAEPGDSGVTLDSVVVDALDGGTIVGSNDGTLSWTPDSACAVGSYPMTVTYTYTGGYQIKAFNLNIQSVDLPPTFPYKDYCFDQRPQESLFWHNDEKEIFLQNPSGTYCFTFAAADEGVVDYQLEGNLPPAAAIDASGHFTCTLGPTPYTLYDFNVIAKDTKNQEDRLHVVIIISVNNQGDPLTTEFAPSKCIEFTDDELAQGYKPIWLGYHPQEAYFTNLTIDDPPEHGSLVKNGLTVTYTPTSGYCGVDAFSYHWNYDAHINSTPPRVENLPTNVGTVQIQVGSWIHLTPNNPSAPDQTIMGVGDTTTVTLTLQNPRSDGLPTGGYWSLEYLGYPIQVFDDQGKEILPNAKNLVTVVGVEKQIVLTVKGVSGGYGGIIAHWHVWDCITLNLV